MHNLQAKHWLIVAAFVGGLALQLSAIDSWDQAFKPKFVAGFMLNASSVIAGIFTKEPRDPDATTRKTDDHG